MNLKYRRTAVMLAVCLFALTAAPAEIQAADAMQTDAAQMNSQAADAVQTKTADAAQTDSQTADAAQDDPGRGRLLGEIPEEFYGGSDGSISLMAKGTIHDSRFAGYTIRHGIDVSKWNGKEAGHPAINWTKVKKSGIDFAIVRAGYRGTSSKGTLAKDPDMAANLKGASEAGLDVGAYIFSQAITKSEAIQEADYLLSLVKGYKLSLPLVFDYEYYSGGRFSSSTKPKLTDRQRTDICLAFCERIEEAGYTPMVYANLSMLKNDLKADEISAKYPIWLARYNSTAEYAGDYCMWQYTSEGSVSGIEGNVDMNYWYVKPSGTTPPANDAVTDGNPQEPDNTDNADNPQGSEEPQEPGATEEPKEPEKLPAPSLTVTGVSADTVELGWSAVAGAEGYKVQRYDTEAKTYKKAVALAGNGATSWTDTGRAENTSYKYRVLAYKKVDGKKEFGTASGAVTARTVEVVKTSVEQSGWTNGEGVNVRKGPGTSYDRLTTLGAVNTKVTVLGTSGDWYQVSLKVSGAKKTGFIQKTYVTILETPKLTLTAKSASKVKVKWTKVAGADGYKIKRYDPAKKKYVLVKNSKGNKTLTFADTGLKKKTTYKYRIFAYKNVRGNEIRGGNRDASVKTKK